MKKKVSKAKVKKAVSSAKKSVNTSKKTISSKRTSKINNEKLLKSTYFIVVALLIIVILGFVITFISLEKTGKAPGVFNRGDSGKPQYNFEDDFDLSVFYDGSEEDFLIEDPNFYSDLDAYYAEIGYDMVNDVFYSGYILALDKPSVIDKKFELEDKKGINEKERALYEKKEFLENVDSVYDSIKDTRSQRELTNVVNEISKDQETKKTLEILEKEHNISLQTSINPVTGKAVGVVSSVDGVKENLNNLKEDYKKDISLKENEVNKTRNEINLELINYKKDVEREVSSVKEQFKNEITDFDKKVLSTHVDLISAIAIDVTPEELRQISNNNAIEKIYPNYNLEVSLNYSSEFLNLPTIWNDLGYTGEGVTIAVIDTGVDYTHPDLGGCLGPSCKVIGGFNFVNNSSNPMDDHGHGTHVAGIAAGTGTSNSLLKGVAPDAKIYALKALNSGGSGSLNNILLAMDRALDPNQDGNYSDRVDVVNMSLGTNINNPNHPLSLYADKLAREGVVMVIAAGNSGPNNLTLGTPGTSRKAITVGASDVYDEIPNFSSRGPTNIGTIKPDVVAPGVDICSAQTNDWLSNRLCLDDSHVRASGTSMAAPQVAGISALLLQKNPNWSPDDIKFTLRNTATNINYDIYTQGHGRVDALSAINSNERPLIVELNKGYLANNKTNFEFYLNNFVEDKEYDYNLKVYSLQDGFNKYFLFERDSSFTSNFIDANYVISIDDILDSGNYFIEFTVNEDDSIRVSKEHFIFNKNINYESEELPVLIPIDDYSAERVFRLLYSDDEQIIFRGAIPSSNITGYKLIYKPHDAYSWEWSEDHVEYMPLEIPFSNSVMAKLDTSHLDVGKTYSFKFVFFYNNGTLRELNLNSIVCSNQAASQRNCVLVISEDEFVDGYPMKIQFEHLSSPGLKLPQTSAHYNYYYQYADLENNNQNNLVVFNIKKSGNKYINKINNYTSTGDLLWSKEVDIGYLNKLTRYPIVDIDGDGKKEIIILSYDRLNAGTPLNPKLYAIDYQGNIKLEKQLTEFYTNSFPFDQVYSLAVEDLTGNGSYEVIVKSNRVTCESSKIHLFVFDNQFNLISHVDQEHGKRKLLNGQYPFDMTIGNFSADPNTKEIAFINYESTPTDKFSLALYLFRLNNNNLELISRIPVKETDHKDGFLMFFQYVKAISGDLDSDGIDEIIVSYITHENREEDVSIYKFDGSLYYYKQDDLLNHICGFRPLSPKILLDYDSDGSLDLFKFRNLNQASPQIEVRNIASDTLLKTRVLDFIGSASNNIFYAVPTTNMSYFKNTNNEHLFAIQGHLSNFSSGPNQKLLVLNQNLDPMFEYLLSNISDASCESNTTGTNTRTLTNTPFILDVDGDGMLNISSSVHNYYEAYIYTFKTDFTADNDCPDCWSTYNFDLKNTNNYKTTEQSTIEQVALPVATPASGNYDSPVAVSLSSGTSGATIKYTTDGTEPLFSSNTYTGPITINSTTTLKAKAFKEGYESSFVMNESYQFPQVANPIATPGQGNYQGAIQVNLASQTPGAVIRYTIDGSIPNQSSPIFSQPITFNSNRTLRAQAFKEGMEDSDLMVYIYNFDFVSQVTATPGSGTYQGTVNVVLSVTTEGAVVRYTTDGSYPGPTAPIYSQPIPVTGYREIRARGYKTGMNPSLHSSSFIYNPSQKVAKPTSTPSVPSVLHEFLYMQSVSLDSLTPGATIRYTLDGSEPNQSSPIYEGPIELKRYAWLKAIAYKDGMLPSDRLSVHYRFPKHPGIEAYPFGEESGVYRHLYGNTPVEVNFEELVNVEGSQIKYKVNPGNTWYDYTGPITIDSSKKKTRFDVRVFTPDVQDINTPVIDNSDNQIIVYLFNTVMHPIAQPRGSWFTQEIYVTLTSGTPGATIRYTLDGSLPTLTNGITYAGDPIHITNWGQTKVRARAFKDGLNYSELSTNTYTRTS